MSSTFLLLFIAVVNVQSSPRAFHCYRTGVFKGGERSIVTYTSCNPHAGIIAHTGIFVAQESGTWQFTFSGTVYVGQSEIYVLRIVQRNPEGHETVLAVSSSDSFDGIGTRETFSMMGVVELRKGSHVWVKVQTKSNGYLTYTDPSQISAIFTGIRVGS